MNMSRDLIDEAMRTDRLSLRNWTGGDAAALFEICRDARVMHRIGDGRPYRSILQALRFIEWAARHRTEHGYTRWAVVERGSGRIVGSCGFAKLPESGEAELGYLFAQRVWGQGYATEAARACLSYAFERLKLTSVVALTDPSHAASQRVVEKLGFACRGEERYRNETNRVYVAVNSMTAQNK